MEKTITISGKKVKFASKGSTPIRYKAQFARDFFVDILKMYPLANLNLEDKENEEEALGKLLNVIDFDIFYDLLWTFAKTADNSIPEKTEWLDQFDSFPVLDLIADVQELIINNLQSKKK